MQGVLATGPERPLDLPCPFVCVMMRELMAHGLRIRTDYTLFSCKSFLQPTLGFPRLSIRLKCIPSIQEQPSHPFARRTALWWRRTLHSFGLCE
jgi:hypothetical protein